MAEVRQDLPDEQVDRLGEMGKAAVKVAASAVVATSLASALAEPPDASLITLPEPTPIVQLYQAYDDDVTPDEDEDTDEQQSRWRRILRALRYLLVALAAVAAIAFGALKGCAGLAGSLLLPPANEEQQEQSDGSTRTSDEDERGVAY